MKLFVIGLCLCVLGSAFDMSMFGRALSEKVVHQGNNDFCGGFVEMIDEIDFTCVEEGGACGATPNSIMPPMNVTLNLCESGLSCVGYDMMTLGSSGVCTEVAPGDTCEDRDSPLPLFDDCYNPLDLNIIDQFFSTEESLGLRCVGGECIQLGAPGDACDDDVYCLSSVCVDSVCTGIALNGNCSDGIDNECVPGTTCIEDVCVAIKGEGEECVEDQCSFTTTCVEGVCVMFEFVDLGEDCSIFDCAYPYLCVNDVCAAADLTGVGEDCSDDYQCDGDSYCTCNPATNTDYICVSDVQPDCDDRYIDALNCLNDNGCNPSDGGFWTGCDIDDCKDDLHDLFCCTGDIAYLDEMTGIRLFVEEAKDCGYDILECDGASTMTLSVLLLVASAVFALL